MSAKGRYLRRKFSTAAYKRSRLLKKTEFYIINVLAVLLVVLFLVFIKDTFITPKKDVKVPIENVAAYRVPYRVPIELKELSEKYGLDFIELLTIYSIENTFFPIKTVTPSQAEIEQSFILSFNKIKSRYRDGKVKPYYTLLKNIFSEIKYFPIPYGYDNDKTASYMYGDSFGAERTYGGDRIHLGTDILDRENIRGRIPVVSMTSGTVKNLGWNELGGYRIGIVTENGNYYYYAHFDSYAENLSEGNRVAAGQLLGYMGDSGYGKEGTRGNFQTHLHLGINPKTNLTLKEFWINPYPFLRFVENSKIEFNSN